YTFGRTGLRCWPIQLVEGEAQTAERERNGASRSALRARTLQVGPPQLLGSATVQGWFRGTRSRAGTLLAAADHLDDKRDRLFVFPAERPAERTILDETFKFARIALSPDGRWLGAGLIDHDFGIRVWDARTGQLAWSLPGDHVYVSFSPDSQWLLGGGPSDYRLWKT